MLKTDPVSSQLSLFEWKELIDSIRSTFREERYKLRNRLAAKGPRSQADKELQNLVNTAIRVDQFSMASDKRIDYKYYGSTDDPKWRFTKYPGVHGFVTEKNNISDEKLIELAEKSYCELKPLFERLQQIPKPSAFSSMDIVAGSSVKHTRHRHRADPYVTKSKAQPEEKPLNQPYAYNPFRVPFPTPAIPSSDPPAPSPAPAQSQSDWSSFSHLPSPCDPIPTPTTSSSSSTPSAQSHSPSGSMPRSYSAPFLITPPIASSAPATGIRSVRPNVSNIHYFNTPASSRWSSLASAPSSSLQANSAIQPDGLVAQFSNISLNPESQTGFSSMDDEKDSIILKD